MDRIQINGDWYVREATKDKENEPIEVIELLAIVYEDSEFYLKAEVAAKHGTRLPDLNLPFVEFIDKTMDAGKTHYADSVRWMNRILEADFLACKEANDLVAPVNMPKFVKCLQELKNRGWI